MSVAELHDAFLERLRKLDIHLEEVVSEFVTSLHFHLQSFRVIDRVHFRKRAASAVNRRGRNIKAWTHADAGISGFPNLQGTILHARGVAIRGHAISKVEPPQSFTVLTVEMPV